MSLSLTERNPYEVRLEVFEGPLDLLLHLIKQNEIDIYDIPIAQIADQYLQHLYLMEQLDLDVAGEFLVMAATLMEIKSKMLLPPDPTAQQDEEPADPRAELVQRLLEYQRYKEVAEKLRDWETERQRLFVRGAGEYTEGYELPVVLADVRADDLLDALRRLLADVGEGAQQVTSIARRRVTVRLRMREVWRKVCARPEGLLFQQLFEGDRSVEEIVMTFLALLELLRLGKVGVRQQGLFAEIHIFRIEEAEAA